MARLGLVESKASQTQRHPPRSKIQPVFRCGGYIVHTAGLSWQQTARDRQAWTQLQPSFIHAHDIPWSTGKQPSVQNLHQTGPANAAQTTHKARTLTIHDARPPPPRHSTQAHPTKFTTPRRRQKERRRRRLYKDKAWKSLLAQLERDSV